jgi:site-specific recombinase XerD
MTAFSVTLQAFFTQRLAQREASPHTVAAYRDSFRLLLSYIHKTTGVAPCQLDFDHLGPERIGAFLEYLETDRHASVATRNARLAAIHSLFRFAALRHPEHMETISRVLAMPPKRAGRAPVCFLTVAETEALIAAPNPSRWTGRRDHALLLLAVQTGLRVSELTSLRIRDIHLGTGAHVDAMGKGRKQRSTPLTTETAAVLRTWLAERGGSPDDPAFPSPRGTSLTIPFGMTPSYRTRFRDRMPSNR